jgi:chaperone BCS1
MPKSPMDDAHKCLSNLIEALEEVMRQSSSSKMKEQGEEVEHIGAIKENS